MQYNIVVEHGKPTSVTVFHEGRVYVAAPDHINYDAIIAALKSGEEPQRVLDLFDIGGAIGRRFRAASRRLGKVFGQDIAVADAAERIEVKHGRILWDGEQVHGALADTILAYYRQDNDDFLPLVRFLSKVMENPNKHSREHLYGWMRHLSFNIHDDGDILAYKGVSDQGDGVFVSTSAGYGVVNGEVIQHGALRNDVGFVVEMPRERVTFDPAEGCSTGLHVGTFSYARGYGSALIEVKIHPRDVVSVPTDCDFQKMRVCRYEVRRVLTQRDIDRYSLAVQALEEDEDEDVETVIGSRATPRY